MAIRLEKKERMIIVGAIRIQTRVGCTRTNYATMDCTRCGDQVAISSIRVRPKLVEDCRGCAFKLKCLATSDQDGWGFFYDHCLECGEAAIGLDEGQGYG